MSAHAPCAGSFGSPLVGGWMAEHVSYGAAFACAVFGELVVVGALLLGRDALTVVETPSSLAALMTPRLCSGRTTLQDELAGALISFFSA